MNKAVKIRNCMSKSLITLSPETEILRAVHTLLKHDIASAPVVGDDGELAGILTERDCMPIVLNAAYYSEHGGLVRDYMSRDVVTLNADDSVVDAAKLFFGEHFHRYPVLENDRLVGHISRCDVLRTLIDQW